MLARFHLGPGLRQGVDWRKEKRLPSELTQWINPAILIVGFLYVLRSMKQMESRMDRMESRVREDI